MPKVSVIIPNYNHAPFLQQRITSVLDQTFKDFELIILDDCSTDNSASIISNFKNHLNISKIEFNKVNSGSTFIQWKKGLQLAKGEWIWIAESDDWCEPSFLSEMIFLISEYPDAVLSYCQSIIFYDNEIINKTFSAYIQKNIKGRDWVVQNMLGNCPLENASMALFKRNDALEVVDKITNFRQCGDWYFWCQLANRGSINVSGKYLNYFRKHSSNVTGTNWGKGYYFTEGAVIFKELIQQLTLNEHEIEFGLNKILAMLRWHKSFFTKDIYQSLENALISIQPDIAQKILKQYQTEQRKVAIKAGIKKLLPF